MNIAARLAICFAFASIDAGSPQGDEEGFDGPQAEFHLARSFPMGHTAPPHEPWRQSSRKLIRAARFAQRGKTRTLGVRGHPVLGNERPHQIASDG
jgi:hypothetical protein